jgi:hypothetical protein
VEEMLRFPERQGVRFLAEAGIEIGRIALRDRGIVDCRT